MKLRTILIGGIAAAIFLVGALLERQYSATAVSEQPAEQTVQQPDYSQIFTDISDAYAQKEIIDLYNREIVNGVSEKQFAPNKSITRAEFITMLNRTLGITPLNSEIPAFRDVPKDSWAYGWIQAGAELGIANGTGPATFSPDVSIRREEAAALLVRALKIATGDIPVSLSFSDASAVSAWAAPYVYQANQSSLMLGYEGNFRPLEPITRQETALVLYRILHDEKWGLQQPESPAEKIQLGWQYVIPTSDYEQRIANSSTLNTLSPRWFFLDATGTFSEKVDSTLLTWARDNGKKVWPLVGNRFNREASHQLFANPAARQAAVTQLTNFVTTYKLDGLNLDFENLDPADRNDFSTFVAELAASMHANNAKLSVDVPMDVGTDWSDAYDYAALGRHADYVVIMAYDEHWTGSTRAGSVSSLSWVDRGVDKILASVPPQKTIVGLPFYTRDWYVKNGTMTSEDLTMPQQSDTLARYGAQYTWDPVVGQYVATYMRDGVRHSIWVEDSRSLARKYQQLERKGVAGFAYWYIGSETPDVWPSFQNVMKYSTIGQKAL